MLRLRLSHRISPARAFVCSICVFLSNANAQEPSYGKARTLQSQAPQLLEKYGAATVAIGVIENDALVWSGVFGEADAEHPASSHTLFNVASLAKPLTAEIVLRLINEKKIALHESVSDTYIDPDLVNDPKHRKLTPALLLSHSSGFPNWRYQQKDQKLAFIAEPGSAFGYSGEGYEYLKHFAERRTGLSFEQLASKYVLEPMHLTNTALTAQQWTEGRVVRPYEEGRFGKPDMQAVGNPSAADNLYTTMEDYSSFLLQVMRGESLNEDVRRDRFRIWTDAAKEIKCKPGLEAMCPSVAGYGLGWVVFRYADRTVVWHSGADRAEHSLAYYIPELKCGAIVFVNGAQGHPVVLDVVDLVGHLPSLSGFMRALKKE